MKIQKDTIENQVQLGLQDHLRRKTERQFQAAHKSIFTATTPEDRELAIQNLDRARDALILFFSYDLADLARLVDEIDSGDAA